MGKKGGKAKMQVVDYFLSTHFGVCYGPVDAITRIIVKEKEAWRGRATDLQQIVINQRNLFGGQKQEGGLFGACEMLPGGPTQLLPYHLAARFDRTPHTMPGYRGITSLFFHGGAAGKGFLWSSNNPYLPTTWVTVERVPTETLPANLARIENLVPEAVVRNPGTGGEDGMTPDAFEKDPLNGYYIGAMPSIGDFISRKYGFRGTRQNLENDPHYAIREGVVYRNYGPDANAAHIILECLTNRDWGMGAPVTAFDLGSFSRLAQTVYDEKFGLSLGWMQQTSVEAFVTEILDHVKAVYYLSPRTGLYTVKAIRDDYEIDGLRVLTPDNANIRSFSRKGWGETVNEIVLTWTNPENEQSATVTMQDLGQISVQGGIVSDSRNLYGIRNQALAMKAASRELREASAPLASFEADLLRTEWDIEPGECVVVYYDEEGVEGAVFRAMDIDYGRVGQPAIKVKFVEDIFALPTFGYSVGSPSYHENTDAMAAPLTHQAFMTAPMVLLVRDDRTDIAAYPEAATMILGASREPGTENFNVLGEDAIPTGAMVSTDLGEFQLTTHSVLFDGLPAEFESTIPVLSAMTPGQDPAIGSMIVIGSTDEESEIVLVTAISPEVGTTVRRGMLDTVPRTWPAGTAAWVLGALPQPLLDPRKGMAGLPSRYKLLPRTSIDALEPDLIPWTEFTPTDRPWAPFRPANVLVGGQRWARAYDIMPASVRITWSNRNRLTEDTVFQTWTAGNVSPEEGQTTVIQVLSRTSGDLLIEHTELEGNSFDLPTPNISGRLKIRVLSERDGIRSIQGVEVDLDLPRPTGYGRAYGVRYGG